MKDVALLTGRVIAGLLVAGHGAQKLFGWFEGPGFAQWTALTESRMGLRPGRVRGSLQIVGEVGGGMLTALALLTSAGLLAETIRPRVTPRLVATPPSGSDAQKEA